MKPRRCWWCKQHAPKLVQLDKHLGESSFYVCKDCKLIIPPLPDNDEFIPPRKYAPRVCKVHLGAA